MDKKTLLQMKVGIFVSLAILLSMMVIVLLGGEKKLFEQHYHLKARFSDISGLRVGAPVFLAGISVGTVEEMKFPRDLQNKEITVRLRIATKYRSRIREDSKASIETQGLLGDKMIFVRVGSPTFNELQDEDFMETEKGFSIDTFAEKGNDLLDNVTRLAKNVNGLVTDVKEKKGLLHALIYDSKGDEIVQQIDKFMREIDEGQVGKNISAMAQNMKKTSANMTDVTSKIDKGEGSIGGFVNDPTVYYDLKTLLGKANRSKLIKAVIRHTMSQNEKDTLK
jgi:phospholipid/cholesterol/gamma-HCH transport system substrate-binding protein